MPLISKPDTPVESSEAVNVYQTSASCPKPGCDGTMEADGTFKPLLSAVGPAPDGACLYRHICSTCGHGQWYAEPYPRVHYVNASISIEEQLRELSRQRLS